MEHTLDIKRLEELALRASRTGQPQFTRFMDPGALDLARQAAGRQRVGVRFYGGYPDAERVMAAFYDGEPPEDWEYPLRVLRISWNPKFASPAHRDLLGAVVGLGIEREATGDIVMATWRDRPCAALFSTDELADYIAANLDSAGRATVKVEPAEEVPELQPPEGSEVLLDEHRKTEYASYRVIKYRWASVDLPRPARARRRLRRIPRKD